MDVYQRTLRYARSKVDFVIGRGLYMLRSDMEMEVGVANGYNNLIQIASDDMLPGYNPEVNEGVELRQNEELSQSDDSSPQPEPPKDEPQNVELVEGSIQNVGDIPLSHDEKKLSIILGSSVIVLVIAYFR